MTLQGIPLAALIVLVLLLIGVVMGIMEGAYRSCTAWFLTAIVVALLVLVW